MAFKHQTRLLILVLVLTQASYGVMTLGPLNILKKIDLRMPTSFHDCVQDVEHKSADCSDRGLNYVPQDLPEDIEELYLGSNNITSLVSSSFQRYHLIIELDLSNNDIRMIEYTSFYPLRDLQRLNLAQNTYLVLPHTGLLRWSTKLSHLNVSYSNLTSIPNDTLKWIRELDHLDLSFNLLTFVNVSSYGVANYVDLAANEFTNLNAENFNFECHTETLNLMGIPIKSVDPRVFPPRHVESLRLGWFMETLSVETVKAMLLGISHSSIQNFTLNHGIKFNILPVGLFDSLRDYSFRSLDLSWNEIYDLGPFTFSNLTRLNHLVVSYNDIVTIDPFSFIGMREIKVLNLNANKIRDINPYNYTWTIDLIELHLSENSLTNINPNTFRGLTNLRYLDLRSNEYLVSIYVTFWDLSNIHSFIHFDELL